MLSPPRRLRALGRAVRTRAIAPGIAFASGLVGVAACGTLPSPVLSAETSDGAVSDGFFEGSLGDGPLGDPSDAPGVSEPDGSLGGADANADAAGPGVSDAATSRDGAQDGTTAVDASVRDGGPTLDGASEAGPSDGGTVADGGVHDGEATDGRGDSGGGTLDGAQAFDASRGLDASASADGASVDAAVSADSGGDLCSTGLGQGPVTPSAMPLDIGVHDPSMIWDGARYYLFATGGTLAVRSSPDLLSWTSVGNVFSAVPVWIPTAIGSTPTDLWAPDISYFSGSFHLYYAGSTFGSNDSAIGLATTATLQSPQWVDRGLIVQSTKTDNFNAIDPNVSFDANCNPWMVFGSYWTGIKLRKLDAATGKLASDNPTTYSLASRNGGSIEAASLISHNGYFYLFVSFGTCCAGANSTYKTMVGRGTSITGPYADKAGADMMTGAAEQLLASSGRYIGPGGGTAWKNGESYLYVYHYYDGQGGGASKLQVRPIAFDASDWIVLSSPVFP